jgi:putative radical SAM enzyme (TIGR03279 family)
MVRVTRVASGSIAEELGIVPGTELVSIGSRALDDFLDWEFLSAEESIELEVRQPSGESIVFEIERDLAEPFGVDLEPPTVRRCANRCEFCFIEGLPKGLRKPLYIRDDDYRLSFAYGNFATLSNLKERDYARIFEYRLSPLYVSVHATPWDARKKLLNNPRVPNVLEQLTRLATGGIRFHCQMVIVPGLNDGDVLEQSLRDLWSFGESVPSVAVVPVGLTQFSHLYSGESMSQEHATALLATVERWGARARAERGATWVYGSDELYLLAHQALPPPEFYGEFEQIENGVGAIAHLRARVASHCSDLPRLDGYRVAVVTGSAMAAILPEILDRLTSQTGAHFEMLPVVNSLFGPTTTTAGLLVGRDIRSALSMCSDADVALIPAESINEDGIFLDDDTLAAVRAESPIPVVPSYDFVDVLSDEAVDVWRIGVNAA